MRNLGPRWLRRTLIAVVVLVVVGAGGIAGLVATYGLDTNTSERVPAGGTKVVPVMLTDFDVTPGTLVVSRGTQLVLDVVNRGDQVHDLAVAGGPGTRMLVQLRVSCWHRMAARLQGRGAAACQPCRP
jgi:hypothetical protein